MALKNLPPGLCEVVLSHVEQLSWKSLHLVNKTWACQVNPVLFSDLSVWIETKSLQRLVSIASDNTIKHYYVRSLTISNEFLSVSTPSPKTLIYAIQGPDSDSGRPYRVYEHLLDKAMRITPTSSQDLIIPHEMMVLGWGRQRLFDTWLLHKELAEEQNALIRDTGSADPDADPEYLDIKLLSEALNSLPNLSEIRLSTNGLGVEEKLLATRGPRIYTTCRECRSDGRQLYILLHAAAASSFNSKNRAKITKLIIDKDF
ncbi:uncharacterized protein PAC_02071 [Phialocephala subalpina]|uniref:Uncharacterized protein n=1 Tax=Phialocephala subalpina TaxID=576137 RepID=A0A1L7WHD8_9HELO|nr:uncharacterized protein PAC_02071 [Phialocephala subalpina]